MGQFPSMHSLNSCCTSWSKEDQNADESHEVQGDAAKNFLQVVSGDHALTTTSGTTENTGSTGFWSFFSRKDTWEIDDSKEQEEEAERMEMQRKNTLELQQHMEAMKAFSDLMAREGLRVVHHHNDKKVERVIKAVPGSGMLEWEPDRVLWVFSDPNPHIKLSSVDKVSLKNYTVWLTEKKKTKPSHGLEVYTKDQASSLHECLTSRVRESGGGSPVKESQPPEVNLPIEGSKLLEERKEEPESVVTLTSNET